MAGHVVNPSTKFEDHYACAVSRDLCVWANFSRIFEIPDPSLPIRYTTFMALRLRQIELFAKIVYGPVLKNTRTALCACAVAVIVNGILWEISELITQERIAVGSSNLVEWLTT